jgi:CBS domain-containing protein
MHVEHFMTRNPVACETTATLRDVALLMSEKGVGSVVVLRNGKVVGLVTDRQLAVRGVAEGKPTTAPVTDVMTENPATLSLDDNLFSAVDTLRSAGVVRRVPVVNAEKELLGVVSISDIAVVAKDLVDAVFLDATHNAMNEAHILTGGKRVVDIIRRPTKEDRLPREQEIRPITSATPTGSPGSGGGAGRSPRTTEPAPGQRAEEGEGRGEEKGAVERVLDVLRGRDVEERR